MIFNKPYNWHEEYPFDLTKIELVEYNGIKQFGVFAKRGIEPDRLIDVCRIIPIDRSIIKATNNDVITDYQFNYNDQFICIALGNGSIYNHSETPNVRHYFDGDLMFIYTINLIDPGEELLINYNKRKI